jgi:hypothetical protein
MNQGLTNGAGEVVLYKAPDGGAAGGNAGARNALAHAKSDRQTFRGQGPCCFQAHQEYLPDARTTAKVNCFQNGNSSNRGEEAGFPIRRPIMIRLILNLLEDGVG